MIEKIAHLADIHIRKSTARHPEYRQAFKNLCTSLKQDKPDRILIAGDLFHDYIKLEGELLVLASEFMNDLSEIAPVIITRGNHDIARSAPNRTDAVEALVKTMRNLRITYHNETGLFEDDNVVWAIWKHGEKRNNPWPKDFVKDQSKVYIDVFHDPINTATNSEGFEFNSKTYRSQKDFMGDISMFGDIHKLQYFSNKTKAYSSSLIEQNFGEGDDQFHGYLLWNILSKNVVERRIFSPYGYYTLPVNRYTDFDNLQLEIDPNSFKFYEPAKKRIRIKWKTLPAVKNIENMRKVDAYLQNKYTPISIKHVNDFIEEKKINVEEKSDIENINQREVIHKVITEYAKKIGVKDELIQDIIDLDVEIENRLTIEDLTNIQWSILRLGGKNFRSYEDIEINWENQDGLYQIVGENGAGKSTINQLISYILYGITPETDFRKKYGDSRFVNNKLNVNYCEGWIIIEANNEYYGLKRVTTIKKNKEGEINGAPTVLSYYKLNSSSDKLDEKYDIEKFTENDRNKTQTRINEIIGTYENFMRVTLTTSDTLNKVLSSDKAPFIDSLLFDSGLDIFDIRSKEFKKYKDELIIDRSIASVNVLNEENSIAALHSNIKFKKELIDSTKEKIEAEKKTLNFLNLQKESTLKSIHQIDPELTNTNENLIKSEIENYNRLLQKLDQEETALKNQINQLKSNYDTARLDVLLKKKDSQKTEEFEKRSQINKHRLMIEQIKSTLAKHNTDIDILKREGGNIKNEIFNLENSKTCLTCGQLKNAESVEKIKQTIVGKESMMFAIADKIKVKNTEKPAIQQSITDQELIIAKIENEIKQDTLTFQNVLEEIGKLVNEKNEVEKRERLMVDLQAYPVKKENILLKVLDCERKIKRYNDQIEKIQENAVLLEQVKAANNAIQTAHSEIEHYNRSISESQNIILNNEQVIKYKVQLIKDYLDFERKEQVRKIYSEIIYRDGIPTQILTNTLLPNINNVLSKLLETADFDVYLDKDDLRLKFFYNDHPNAIIDCISASGMERTFAVYALKIALNQINSKSKSTLLTVDEVMGKLKGEYVDKFVDLLHLSKKFYKKVLIIEPTHEVNPDYLLQIEKNENHISKLILN
jgi:hypothetical protein